MTTEGSRLERFLVSVARVASGSGLHPLAILQAVESAARRSTSDGNIANAYLVELNPADARVAGENLAELKASLVRMLDDYRHTQRVGTTGPWVIEWGASSAVTPGSVSVAASFRTASQASARPVQPRETQVITRQRGKSLVVEGAGRVPLTHTPFVIGRAAGCDLTIVDFAMSRRHAVIEQASNGQLLIRDLGSRNRLVSDGVVGSEFILHPGIRVTLGSTTLLLEEAS